MTPEAMPNAERGDMLVRNFLAAGLIACCAVAAMAGTGLLLFGWKPGDIAEYQYSEALGNLLGVWSVVAGAAVLLLLVPRPYWTYLVSVAILPIPFAAAMLYEGINYPTSHNLLPFEVAIWLIGSMLIHIPSAILKGIYLLTVRMRSSGTKQSDNTRAVH